MGTDLRMYAETKSIGGNWLPVPAPKINEFVPWDWQNRVAPSEVFEQLGRCVRLFSVLANKPIGLASNQAKMPPLWHWNDGFPDDMNPLYREYFEDEDVFDPLGGDWGVRWALTTEILNFNWTTHCVNTKGHTFPELALRIRNGYIPTEKDLNSIKIDRPSSLGDSSGILEPVSWRESVKDWVGKIWLDGQEIELDTFLHRIRSLGPSNATRIVCWFNS